MYMYVHRPRRLAQGITTTCLFKPTTPLLLWGTPILNTHCQWVYYSMCAGAADLEGDTEWVLDSSAEERVLWVNEITLSLLLYTCVCSCPFLAQKTALPFFSLQTCIFCFSNHFQFHSICSYRDSQNHWPQVWMTVLYIAGLIYSSVRDSIKGCRWCLLKGKRMRLEHHASSLISVPVFRHFDGAYLDTYNYYVCLLLLST